MMTKDHIMADNELAVLADRVEGLTEPDRAVDYDIAHHTGDHFRNGGKAPRYTASLDAAMMLVPEGWTFANLSQSDRKGWGCELRHGHLTSYDATAFGSQLENTNAAIAVIAACLRARSRIPTPPRIEEGERG